MTLPQKPRYMQPCNHCGLCCSIALCPVGAVAFPGERAPCPALVEGDGKAKCALVMAEEAFGLERTFAKALGIGCGCSMPDRDTTEAQMRAFDNASFVKMYGRQPKVPL